MSFLKKLHPMFQFLVIALLFGAYLWTAISYHIAFLAAVLLLLECAALGASVTTHEENTLKYNLEDVEQDTLAGITAKLSLYERKVLGKIIGLAAKAKAEEHKIVTGIRKAL
jgi:hypothetical protein